MRANTVRPTAAFGLLAALATGASGQGALTFESLDAPVSLRPGESFRVAARWKIAEPVSETWTVSLELLRVPNGPKFAAPLQYSGAKPGLEVGDPVSYSSEITLPVDAPSGDYELRIEHYRRGPKGWERLPIRNADPKLRPFCYRVYHLRGAGEEDSLRVVAVPTTAAVPKIDGKLDDAVWRLATRIERFVLPMGDAEPREPTEVLLTRDARNLFIGFRCRESQMPKLTAKVRKRDADVWNDDCVEIFLDVNRTRATYFHFIVNALGTQYDALTNDSPWNAKWLCGTAREASAWTAEIALPLSELGVQALSTGDSWFANFCREEKPSGELSCWSPTGGSSFAAPGAFAEVLFGSYTDQVAQRRSELQKRLDALRAEVAVPRLASDAKLQEAMAQFAKHLEAFLPAAANATEYAASLRELRQLSAELDAVKVQKLRATLGGEDYVLWERNPWLDFAAKTNIADIPGETAALEVVSPRNATESRALMVTNLAAETLHARLLLTNSEPLSPTLDILMPTFVRTADGRVTADAMPPADAIRQVVVPAGETRQIFLNLKSGDTVPGDYRLRLVLSPLTVSKKEKAVEIRWTILAPRLPEVVPHAVFGWDTLADGGMEREYLRTLVEHRFNTFALWGLRLRPHRRGDTNFLMVHGTDQNKPGLDFAEFDRLLALKKTAFGDSPAKSPKFYVVLTCWESGGANVDNYMNGWGTPVWVEAFKKAILALRDRFLRQGLTYADFALNPVDESIAEPYVQMATWIKQADPKLLVISDSLNGDCVQVKKADAVTDLWCPNYGCFGPETTAKALAYLRTTGKPLWMYYYSEGANEKARPAYKDYLWKHWFAFQQNLSGVCYWTVSQHYGDPWNRHQTSASYDPSLFYKGATAPITGRRFEAWRQGAEDYALLSMVRETAARMKPKNPALASEAELLLQEAVDTVVRLGGDPNQAGAYRGRLAKTLARLLAEGK